MNIVEAHVICIQEFGRIHSVLVSTIKKTTSGYEHEGEYGYEKFSFIVGGAGISSGDISSGTCGKNTFW